MLSYKSDFQGYACKFSPFVPDIVACGVSQYYGIIGNGKLIVLKKNQNSMAEIKKFDTNDGIFDIAFSEMTQNHIMTVGAGGNLKLWDYQSMSSKPIVSLKRHNSDIWGCSWGHLTTNLVATAGSDSSMKVTDITKGNLVTQNIFHNKVAYSCSWHPTLSSVIASTSADGTCKLFDITSNKVIKSFSTEFEVMTCDFNKYENKIAIGLSNGMILIYDLRGDKPVMMLNGHTLTTRKLQFSPFDADTLVSVSYDMNVNLWNIKQSLPINVFKYHTEFVYGIDFNLFEKGTISTTGWDNSLYVLNVYSNNLCK